MVLLTLRVMESVPPRGSRWVQLSLHSTVASWSQYHRAVAGGCDDVCSQRPTHPLPRGGTDSMTLRCVLYSLGS